MLTEQERTRCPNAVLAAVCNADHSNKVKFLGAGKCLRDYVTIAEALRLHEQRECGYVDRKEPD